MLGRECLHLYIYTYIQRRFMVLGVQISFPILPYCYFLLTTSYKEIIVILWVCLFMLLLAKESLFSLKEINFQLFLLYIKFKFQNHFFQNMKQTHPMPIFSFTNEFMVAVVFSFQSHLPLRVSISEKNQKRKRQIQTPSIAVKISSN